MDDIKQLIIDKANKKHKGLRVANFLSEKESVKNWISTGSTSLDVTLSNKFPGGYASGMVLDIFGPEHSGKSLMAAYACKSIQQMGGIAVYIDSEHSLNKEFMQAIGVNLDELIEVRLRILEDIWELVDDVITTTYEKNPDKPTCIVIDSMDATVPKNEHNEKKDKYDKAGWNTDKAIINSKALRKLIGIINKTNTLLIIVRQTRDNLGITFGDASCVDPHTTKLKIRYKRHWFMDKKNKDFIYDDMTMAQISDLFANNDDFDNPEEFDINPDFELQAWSYDKEKQEDVYKPISLFVIKDNVSSHYTDGKIKVSRNHKFIVNNEIVLAHEHNDFKKVNEPLQIVDVEILDTHVYYANGHLNHNTTSGGNAIAFYASARIKLQAAGKIKPSSSDEIIGINTKAKIVKNRFGPNYRTAEFRIFYDRGIDDMYSWITVLKDYGKIKTSGSWLTWINEATGERITAQGEENLKIAFENLDDETKEDIKKEVANCLIRTYKSDELKEEDIEITNEEKQD